MKVCEKVQRKGVTTYNEVADELVNEFTDPQYMLTEQAHVRSLRLPHFSTLTPQSWLFY